MPKKYDVSGREFLFRLNDGTEVYDGDILYHPDLHRVGWYCVAEFKPNSIGRGATVTVRSPSGAVPTVSVSELRREPPEVPARCSHCGQTMPWVKRR